MRVAFGEYQLDTETRTVQREGGGSPARGKRHEHLAAAHCVCEVVKEAAASRSGSRKKTARIRMQMSTSLRLIVCAKS